MRVPIEISARHIHLCQKDLEVLFGPGYQLRKLRDLTLPSQFAAQETLIVKNRERQFDKIRVVGPLRPQTQVELSLTDTLYLKVEPVLRVSGDLQGTSGIGLIGPQGEVFLKQGVIVAQRHIHLDEKTAHDWGVEHGDMVSVQIEGERGLVFGQVVIRVSKDYKLVMHLDTDEGNACGISKKGMGDWIVPNS